MSKFSNLIGITAHVGATLARPGGSADPQRPTIGHGPRDNMRDCDHGHRCIPVAIAALLACLTACSGEVDEQFDDSEVSSLTQALTRGCDAAYEWETTGGSFKALFGQFDGEGSCGSTVPNRCRERAKDAARACMITHWETRWDFERPDICYTGSGVIGYSVGDDIKFALEKAVCQGPYATLSNDTEVHVRLRARTWGGTDNCDSSTLLSSDYEINCEHFNQVH